MIKSGAPHIRGENSVPRIMWTVVLALVPAVVAFIFVSGFSAFRIFVVSSASALLAEMGIWKLRAKRATLYDGSALLTSILFALFLPADLASWKVALGSAFGIIFGKQVFGGLGQNPFNPALVGCAFVFAAFPASISAFRESLGALHSTSLASAILLGGLALLLMRLIHWEIPLLYLGGYALFCLALGYEAGEKVLDWPILLGAFFLVTDPVTTPLTRMGEQWFALGAGILSALFAASLNPFQGITYAVLWMNALNPWLDREFRPSRARSVYGLRPLPG